MAVLEVKKETSSYFLFMDLTEIIGKTITSVKQKKLVGYDDTGFLEISFSDNTKILVVSSYDGYSPNAYDEYPTTISICEPSFLNLEDIK